MFTFYSLHLFVLKEFQVFGIIKWQTMCSHTSSYITHFKSHSCRALVAKSVSGLKCTLRDLNASCWTHWNPTWDGSCVRKFYQFACGRSVVFQALLLPPPSPLHSSSCKFPWCMHLWVGDLYVMKKYYKAFVNLLRGMHNDTFCKIILKLYSQPIIHRHQ